GLPHRERRAGAASKPLPRVLPRAASDRRRGDRGRPSPARDAPRSRLAARRAGAGVSAVRLEHEPRGIARLTLARPDVKNAFAEVRVGILPAVVSPYVVRKVGAARATALFVTGARIDATRAHEIGLVERLAEPAELDAAVGRVVAAILEGSPAAVKAAKRLVREVEGRPPAEVADLTVSRIADIRVSGEGQEGLRAFLEKRKPRW